MDLTFKLAYYLKNLQKIKNLVASPFLKCGGGKVKHTQQMCVKDIFLPLSYLMPSVPKKHALLQYHHGGVQ